MNDSIQFQQWFGNSKVINGEGKPLIMYHADNRKMSKLEPSMRNSAEASLVWFSSTPLREYGSNIYEAYLKIENPISDKEYDNISNWGGRTFAGIIRKSGYDGVLSKSAGGFIAGVLDSSQIYLINK